MIYFILWPPDPYLTLIGYIKVPNPENPDDPSDTPYYRFNKN